MTEKSKSKHDEHHECCKHDESHEHHRHYKHPEMPEYQYRGARALVLLHERKLQRFYETWLDARENGVKLPETKDPDYASLDTLLRHVLRAARGYMTWMCEKLELPDPGIEPTPEVDRIAGEAELYLEHLLEKWRAPLAEVPEERFLNATYLSRWNTQYCIDSMLEHAVVHPMRHRFQLKELLASAR